ncbi:hypothetical protein Pssp01_42250 [Pseudomonas sp. NBRC 100443]|nr:hypothetical protein Pssp01_42250 [Pseudomonas sp. NBRC 100443]
MAAMMGIASLNTILRRHGATRRAHNAYGVIRRLTLIPGGSGVDLGVGHGLGVSADNRERLFALRFNAWPAGP